MNRLPAVFHASVKSPWLVNIAAAQVAITSVSAEVLSEVKLSACTDAHCRATLTVINLVAVDFAVIAASIVINVGQVEVRSERLLVRIVEAVVSIDTRVLTHAVVALIVTSHALAGPLAIASHAQA